VFASGMLGSPSAPASGLAPKTDENTSGRPLAYGFANPGAAPARAAPSPAAAPPPRAAALLPAAGAIEASSLSASATISTLPSASDRFDSTTASAPSASRTRRNASRLVAPVNLRMFKLDP